MENMLEAFTVKEYFSEGMTVTDVASACQRLADSGDTRYCCASYCMRSGLHRLLTLSVSPQGRHH